MDLSVTPAARPPTTLPLDRVAFVVGVVADGPLTPSRCLAVRAAFERWLADFALRYVATPLVLLTAEEGDVERMIGELGRERGIPVVAYPIGDSVARIAYHSHLVFTCCEADGPVDRVQAIADIRLRGPGAASLGGVPALPDVGPVIQLRVLDDDRVAERRLFPVRFHHDRDAERDFWSALGQFDRYNRDLHDLAKAKAFPAGIEGLRERTSFIAGKLQGYTQTALIWLYVLALAAAMMQVLIGSRGESPIHGIGAAGATANVGELAKIVTLVLAFGVYLLTRSNDWENRYQDYRALSGALRVQSVWAATGLPVAEIERCFLREQQSELVWIRFALRYAGLAGDLLASPPAVSDSVWRTWVRSQWRYYYRAARRQAATLRAFRRAQLTLIVLAVVATAFGVVLITPLGSGVHVGQHTASLLLTAPLAIASAAALLVSHYCEKRAYESNAKRYERMFVVFDRARRQLLLVVLGRTPGDVPALVRELSEAALVEQADWLLLRRERPWSFVGT